eukprot:TRINITY_DN5286_c0_g1_i1.p1 TRINITY_DN5286_c0_g1~~TRINITY_DN5286_c0_g1_i1.p1  ORF type:complete len:679 (-),score=119.66 TRINITY_DN5286_c0_g1_i1:38-2074(-)
MEQRSHQEWVPKRKGQIRDKQLKEDLDDYDYKMDFSSDSVPNDSAPPTSPFKRKKPAIAFCLRNSTDEKCLRTEDDENSADVSKEEFKGGSTLQFDEDQEHEFKSVTTIPDPAEAVTQYCMKYINAFLNTNGGTLFFGVEDDGTIIGLKFNRKKRDQLRLRVDGIVSNFKPQVDPELWKLEFIPVSGHQPESPEEASPYVVRVTVKRGRAPVYINGGGKAFLRYSGSTHQMNEWLIKQRKDVGRTLIATGSKPSYPKDFIGREDEIALIEKFVSDTDSATPVVLLYGPPLVGKSALAKRLAYQYGTKYPDGYFYLDLKSATSHYIEMNEAMLNVIRTCYPHRELPANPTNGELHGIYESCFTNKKCLLMIENAGSSKQIQDLVPHSSRGCLLLVTSRKDLELDVELDALRIRLSALKPESSAKLLTALVPQIDEKQAQDMAQLCGNMPLCLRVLGSALNKNANAQNSRGEVKNEADKLIKKLSNEEKRMELIESSFETSFDSYPDELKLRHMSLSLFAGPFDGSAAPCMFDETYEEAEDDLRELLDCSLLEFDKKSSRYYQNDLLRLYALNRAKRNENFLESLEARYLSYFANVIETIVNLEGDIKTKFGRFFRLERINVDAAVLYFGTVPDCEAKRKFAKAAQRLAAKVEGIDETRWNKLAGDVLKWEPPTQQGTQS